MKKQNLVQSLHKPVNPIVATTVIGVVLLIGASLFSLRFLNKPSFPYSEPPKITHFLPTATPATPSATPSPAFNQHTFTSPDLGISFDYIDDDKIPIHLN